MAPLPPCVERVNPSRPIGKLKKKASTAAHSIQLLRVNLEIYSSTKPDDRHICPDLHCRQKSAGCIGWRCIIIFQPLTTACLWEGKWPILGFTAKLICIFVSKYAKCKTNFWDRGSLNSPYHCVENLAKLCFNETRYF